MYSINILYYLNEIILFRNVIDSITMKQFPEFPQGISIMFHVLKLCFCL